MPEVLAAVEVGVQARHTALACSQCMHERVGLCWVFLNKESGLRMRKFSVWRIGFEG